MNYESNKMIILNIFFLTLKKYYFCYNKQTILASCLIRKIFIKLDFIFLKCILRS